MEILSIVLLVIFIMVFSVIFYLLFKKIDSISKPQENDTAMGLLNQNIIGMQKTLNERLEKAAQVISGVQKELGGVQEIGRQIKDFQEFLRSPKIRGNVGEQVLRDLLEQMIPKANFKLQYNFKSGERVDAVIKTKNGLIPIDSKFPMENYQKSVKAKDTEDGKKYLNDFFKDVKKHVNSISKKYILPAEGTVDFAIMYLPSEAIFFETSNNLEINNYAGDKKILFVSPNSFYYFLKIILQALENEKIDEKAREIANVLHSIQQDARKFGDDLGVLNRHVTNAKNTMDTVNNSYLKLDGKIEGAGKLQNNQVKEIEEKLPEIEEEIKIKV